MKVTITIIAAIAFLLIPTFNFSQQIQYSEERNYLLGVQGIFNLEDGSFFVLTTNSRTASKELDYYSEINAKPIKKDLLNKILGKKVTFIKCLLLDNKMYAFQSVRDGNILTLYCQEYGKDCLPKGDPKELFSYEREKDGWEAFTVIQSENKDFFAVENLGLSGNEKDDFKFKVFNSNLELVNEGSYSIYLDRKAKKPELKYWISKKEVSNEGEFYIGANELISSDGSKPGKYVLWTFENSSLTEYFLNLNGKKPISFVIAPQSNGIIKCIGFCKDSLEKGSFYVEVDTERNSCDKFKFNKMTDWGNISMGITDFYTLPNGDFFLIAEFFHKKLVINNNSAQSNYNGGGEMRFYYDDIKGIKIDGNGNLKWSVSFGHCNQIVFPSNFERSYIGYLNSDNQYIMLLNGNTTNDGIDAEAEYTVAYENRTNLKIIVLHKLKLIWSLEVFKEVVLNNL